MMVVVNPLYSDTNKEIPKDKSYDPSGFIDYDLELVRLWRKHISETESNVLVEDCGGIKTYEWSQNPDVKVRIYTARAYTNIDYCSCPKSETGKIKIDQSEHLPDCRLRKKAAKRSVKASAVPDKIEGGYSLGVPL
jgi:hypothetical protein